MERSGTATWAGMATAARVVKDGVTREEMGCGVVCELAAGSWATATGLVTGQREAGGREWVGSRG